MLGGPDYAELRDWRDRMLEVMEGMPGLVDPDSNYQERKPQINVLVDRDRAAALGVSLASVGRTLETMLGSRTVTTCGSRSITRLRARAFSAPSSSAPISSCTARRST